MVLGTGMEEILITLGIYSQRVRKGGTVYSPGTSTNEQNNVLIYNDAVSC
jgi:hypothetical protein